MPSPFPGMNPYLEHPRVWQDYHHTFITMAREALIPQLTPKYFVRIQERVYLHEPDESDLAAVRVPNATVTTRGRRSRRTTSATSTVEAPVQLKLPELVRMRISSLDVVLRGGERIVTAIELLSRSNKTHGENRENYVAKRKDLMTAGVNFVELDLLRDGPRQPLPGLPPCDYYAMVFRPSRKPLVDVWPVRLRDPWPPVPIPLSPGDDEAKLDVKKVIDRAYDGSGYEHHIYLDAPQPPLPAADATWAEGITRAAIVSRPAG